MKIAGRIIGIVRRHRRASLGAAVVAAALLAAGLYWFQPWKLFTSSTVDEAIPMATVAPSQLAVPSMSPGVGPHTLSSGAFRSLEHHTTGLAKVVSLGGGRRIVRLENLDTSNGPDLVVLLSDTPASEDGWRKYDDGTTLYLGKLKGNKGNQNYEIPAGTDLSKFRSVVIWCRRFTVGFGAASILPAA